jgi:N-acetylmannosamine-6-phosphate 2-epimerase / N-acetylmannosamine kinase
MTMNGPNGIIEAWRGNLIVSCQAPEGTALGSPGTLARIAKAAVDGGAVGVRANGPDDVAAIRAAVSVPIIGIAKRMQADGKVLITPTFESAQELLAAGANAIALDCTERGQRLGALGRLTRIRAEFGVPVLADIATIEEARAAEAAGADFVLTTLRGYTPETKHIRGFDLQFVRDLARELETPVIAEGRIGTPQQAAAALEAGAFAVIVGTAITRPDAIVRRFVGEMQNSARAGRLVCIAAVDLGGTNTKHAVVRHDGSLLWQGTCPTPALDGREGLLRHLTAVVANCVRSGKELGFGPEAIGIATAGWVDPDAGKVIYATGNLPGWAGAAIRSELERDLCLPVSVENDANAMAVAEKRFGLGQAVNDMICLTLGTGVGGGCYNNGRLSRGSYFLGNAFGHVTIEPGGLPCTCGQAGCLEAYANAAALLRYAGSSFRSAEQVTSAALAGDPKARKALRTYAGYLARGLAILLHILDPELVVLSGGIAENNTALLEYLEEELSRLVIGWEHRSTRLALSKIARYGGVMGAAAIALDDRDLRIRAGVEWS